MKLPHGPLVLCLGSAILGALLAKLLTDEAAPLSAFGQDSSRERPVARLADDGYTPEERVNIAVYDNANRAVVNINTRGVRSGNFFTFDVPTEGEGSGSVIDKTGHILTNYHVIEDAREIEVTLFDASKYRAQLVGQDPENDVAVIRINAAADLLHPVVFGNSAKLRVGQRVFAIGNPFGLERTLTTGIISSLNRTLPARNKRQLKSIIQIDAAINPGNSGGPLLDTHSRLIGMNTAIASRSGTSTGVGFAIPVGIIARIVPQLIEKGRVVRPETGIAKVYETERGLLIAALTTGGPAEHAGLRGPRVVRERHGPLVYESTDLGAADLIVSLNGSKVTTVDEFLSGIENLRPGDEVTVGVIRGGRESTVRMKLGGEE
jgi:S1-C subfamily serine protease